MGNLDDKKTVHEKRLQIFKDRLNKLMAKNNLNVGKLVEELNKPLDEKNRDKYKEETIKTYIESDTPKEPNIFNAIEIARIMGKDLYYMFGVDQGELIYTANVTSLLVNLFRTFYNIDGVEVEVRRATKEIVIKFNSPIQKIIQDVQNANQNGTISYISEIQYPYITVEKSVKELKEYLKDDKEAIIKTAEEISGNFKGKLQNIMGDLGISNKELAQYTQLDERTIQNYTSIRIDRENKKIPINNLIDVACVLDVNPEYLLGFDLERKPFRILDTPESKVLNLYKALNYAKFETRDEDNQIVAYTSNETIYLFFKQFELLRTKNIKIAYNAAKKVDSEKLWIVNGEIQQFDPSIRENDIELIRFIIDNNLYNNKLYGNSAINKRIIQQAMKATMELEEEK